ARSERSPPPSFARPSASTSRAVRTGVVQPAEALRTTAGADVRDAAVASLVIVPVPRLGRMAAGAAATGVARPSRGTQNGRAYGRAWAPVRPDRGAPYLTVGASVKAI